MKLLYPAVFFILLSGMHVAYPASPNGITRPRATPPAMNRGAIGAEPGARVASTKERCGNGGLEGQGGCDDGNVVGGDGCDTKCRSKARKVAVGGRHTCIVTLSGRVKCWGSNESGQLGYGDTNNRGAGPGETADELKYVDLGRSKVADVALAEDLTCALLDSREVKCWGRKVAGTTPESMGYNLKTQPLGAAAVAIDASNSVCVALENGTIKCLSENVCIGVGFDRSSCPASPARSQMRWTSVHLTDHQRVRQMAAGSPICALRIDGSIKCWGDAWYSSALGYWPVTRDILERSVPDVPLGRHGAPKSVASGGDHVCVLFESGEVGCWGVGDQGALGHKDPTLNECPLGSGVTNDGSVLPYCLSRLPKKLLHFESKARQVFARPGYSCALLEDGKLECWGAIPDALAIEETAAVSGEKAPQSNSVPRYAIKMPRSCHPLSIVVGEVTCVLCDDGCLKCWGYNDAGQLGYGDKVDRSAPPDQCVPYADGW